MKFTCNPPMEYDRALRQLREWRETVGPILDAWDGYDYGPNRDTVGSKQALYAALRNAAARLRRLLSATPDDPRSPDARAAEAEIDRIAAEQQGPVEPMAPAGECERLRRRIEELEADHDRAVGRAIRPVLQRAKDAENRVEELYQGRRMLIDGMAAVQARATRAETAVGAMRRALEKYETSRSIYDEATVVGGVRSALADYDANKPEPTDEQVKAKLDDAADKSFQTPDEQPQARAGGNKIKLKLPCDADPETDSIEFSAWSHEVVVTVQDDDGWKNAVLSRESVRRLVDWALAWLGAKHVDRAMLRHWLYRHTPSTQTRFDMDEVIGLLAQLVYEWPVVVERDGGGS